jgi:hypothetical protein
LVSTISFSGLARMDYSLLGNNVLKDHRCPILAFFARVGTMLQTASWFRLVLQNKSGHPQAARSFVR